MPASTRTYVSRATTSIRPYDRPSPTASPSPPPAPPVQISDDPADHPGLPTYAEYKRIEAGYLHSLSPRKRDKALITQAMFDKIWDVLHQPEACTVETPQFRFWVRKMFTLSRLTTTTTTDARGAQREWQWGHRRDAHTRATADGEILREDDDGEEELELERAMGIGRGTDAEAALLSSAVVLHENRPVAIMEQLYELFCYCHVRAGHGGRDKTCAVIRQHYSWVPKELTAQFVKACPTCALKRGGGGEPGVGVQRRTSGGRERKGKATTVNGTRERMSAEPSSLGWPTTGGPLDPENPLPCGVRERERPQRVHEHAEPIGPSNLVSPARGPTGRIGSAPREVFLGSCLASGWNNMPRASTAHVDLPPSPFRLYDPIHGYASQTYPVDTTRTGSPSQTGDLPSLATALSNESLDDNLNLTGLGEGEGGCLPPALRPLRLSGPVPSTTAGAPESEDADLFQYQIDPALLSFGYPGVGVGHTNTRMHTPSSSFASPGADGPGLALSPTRRGGTSMSTSEVHGDRCMNPAGLFNDPHRLRLRATGMTGPALAMPALDTSDSTTASSGSDSPDSRFERSATSAFASGMGTFKPFTGPRRSPPRYCGYDVREQGSPGLATMLLSCSTDDSVDGGSLSRFSILMDA